MIDANARTVNLWTKHGPRLSFEQVEEAIRAAEREARRSALEEARRLVGEAATWGFAYEAIDALIAQEEAQP